jgi:hypothetical protein
MIYVFKTCLADRQASVKTKAQAKKLTPHIDKILPKAKCLPVGRQGILTLVTAIKHCVLTAKKI